jgi:pimeloyl-ACP methyl ester carboxylesterase
MSTAQLSARRRSIEIPSGRVSFLEQGEGPVALFVHGVLLNAHMWEGVIDGVADARRCIAPDLLTHGATRERPDADVSFAGQAQALVELVDALEVERIDVVANDSGGGIAQILAARHPHRIRTLTLTNCDVHDGWPPPAFEPTVQAARAGGLGGLLRSLHADAGVARAALAPGFEYPERLSDDTLRGFIAPFFESEERIAALERFFCAMDCRQTVEIEPLLRRLTAPTLIVWGTADIFFDIKWAHWLRQTIPGARPVVELPGAKLFFPIERPARLSGLLRRHWGVASDEPVETARAALNAAR